MSARKNKKISRRLFRKTASKFRKEGATEDEIKYIINFQKELKKRIYSTLTNSELKDRPLMEEVKHTISELVIEIGL
jgi:hypothetical protein